MIEINGHAIAAHHVAVIGAIECTRDMHYRFDIALAGHPAWLGLVFDDAESAAQARLALIAHVDAEARGPGARLARGDVDAHHHPHHSAAMHASRRAGDGANARD